MPIYEYTCPGCGNSLTLSHPMIEVDEAHHCPDCGAVLRRRLQPTHFRFLGVANPLHESNPAVRRLLNPEFQARRRDELAREKDEHLKREAKEREHGTG